MPDPGIYNNISNRELNLGAHMSSPGKSDLRENSESSSRNLDSAQSENNSNICMCNNKCFENQEKIIERALKQLEVKIFDKLTEIERKQEQKMNQILDMLSNQKTCKE